MTRPDEIAALADAKASLADHVASFWKLLETETVHLAVNIRMEIGHEAPDGPTVYYDCTTFSDEVAKELVRLSATSPGDGVREALTPFAREADRWDVSVSDDFWPVSGASYTVGDFRRAKAALAPAEKAGDELPLYNREREIISNESYDIGWRDGYEKAVGGQPRNTLSDEQIKYMVDRFLSWKLPRDAFNPDCGISFDKEPFNKHTAHPMLHEPMGTNLFDATQADAMVRHMIDELPTATPTPPSADVAKVEKRAKEIYDGFAYEGPGNKPAWVNGGNSSKQNDARALAQAETKYDDGEAPWTEDEQFAEQQNACIARRKKYGQRHCDEKDGSCTECEHDAQVMLRRKYLIQSAAPGGGTDATWYRSGPVFGTYERITPSDPAQEPAAVALKPCPFCGGEAKRIEPANGGRPYVACLECLSSSLPSQNTVERWNTRPVSLDREAIEQIIDPTAQGDYRRSERQHKADAILALIEGRT